MMQLTAVDRLEIFELQVRYAEAIDGRNGALLDTVFTDDIDADYGMLGRLQGLQFVIRWMDMFHLPFDATQHTVSNHRVAVDGDEVDYRSYAVATLVCKGTPGGDYVQGGAHYLDRVVHTGAGWRIRAREIGASWGSGNPKILEVGMQSVARLLGGDPHARK
jgi:hypothetical protein